MILLAPILALAFLGDGNYRTTLTDGTVVRLLSVSDDPRKRVWTPSGLLTKPMALGYAYSMPEARDEKAFLIDIETRKIHVEPRVGYRSWKPNVQSLGMLQNATNKFGPKRWVTVILAKTPPNKAEFDLDIKLANSDWVTVQRAIVSRGKVLTRKSFAVSARAWSDLYKGPMKPAKGIKGFPMILPDESPRYQQRVAAFGRNGKELPGGGSIKDPTVRLKELGGRHGVFSFEYFGSNLNDVSTLKIQIRPWQTVQFKHVKLSPTETRPKKV